ncbi:hypothetical protein [Vibrio coralliirubri]|uniref:hypothetical protein n=1 Tax=Vibrio coralliirubri TaxID=1516159 RepID=UPI000EFCF321|nr:hypothetical protein [Vibrio coralliirubri]
MKFYHFTRKDALNDILKVGIKPGITPLGVNNVFVSLTSLLTPAGNGLITGQCLIEGVSPQFEFMKSHYPSLVSGKSPNRQLQLFDQTEVVLEIEIDKNDPKLLTYDSYIDVTPVGKQANKELCKAAGLASARFPIGGPEQLQDQETLKILNQKKPIAPHWYFYEGVIPPSMFTVKHRQQSGQYA